MNERQKIRNWCAALGVATLGGVGVLASPAFAGDVSDMVEVNTTGYVRTWAGFLLQKQPETGYNRFYDPAQLRATIQLDNDIKMGPATAKLLLKYDREAFTDYQGELNRLNRDTLNVFHAYAPTLTQGRGSVTVTGHNYMDQYQTMRGADIVREAYIDFDYGSRTNIRVGKQQLVWGESDFFHAMDIIHGFDYRTRLFFEDNQDYRKPLFLLKANVSIPEGNGSLEAFVRPGLDQGDLIGNSYNLEGGLWAVSPYHGINFTQGTSYNYHSKSADKNDPTGGIRWKGDLGDVGYSVAWIRTFNPDPVINPPTNGCAQAYHNATAAFNCAAAAGHNNGILTYYGVGNTTPWKQEPTNQVWGDWIHPETHTFGVSANKYVDAVDAVFSTEITFTPNKPYNYGYLNSDLPGWAGIKEKDTVVSMFRVDKNMFLEKIIGTNRPSLSSLQLFDTWLLNYQARDQIVEFASFGHLKQEHTTYATYFLLLNYFGDTVNPFFVVGTDVTNDGGFILPGVDFRINDQWSVKVEGDLFWDTHNKRVDVSQAQAFGAGSKATNFDKGFNVLGLKESDTGLFGWFHNADQFVVRVTRQF